MLWEMEGSETGNYRLRSRDARLRDGGQLVQVLLVLGGVEVGDAALDAAGVVQLAPEHHLVVRARRLLLVVEAAQRGGLAVAPAAGIRFRSCTGFYSPGGLH